MKLIFATNNSHKLHEVQEKLRVRSGEACLATTQIKIVSLAEIGFSEDIPETGDTLQANALQKAQTIYNFCHQNCFADDTGLEIEALNGEPGVYSARYAERCGVASNTPTFDDNINLVLSKLHGKTNRKACFKTVIALILNGEIFYFEGRVDGEIITEKHGVEGFGYDPIFRPDGYKKTFAELPLDEKNQISHRARAVDKLVEFLT
ncbi:MAG: RdgB/HAM1 family non-canonical purine NTP pyrophosphatase [Bacteroidales bacterium]|jgi:XTP/dITP diphosphohydrolase|nr:RdgB/HAM1 family non-canonical purine NTP pyrophosphatase [Bacteroidales bacterium]